jgi:hypothetical protein
MPFSYPSLADRIVANSVLAPDSFHGGTPCWLWTGAYTVNRSGMHYGKLNVRISRGRNKGKPRTWFAHRLTIVVFHGRRMSKRSRALHLCNNTICVNPAHLVGGSQRQNVQQCVREGRHFTPFKTAK